MYKSSKNINLWKIMWLFPQYLPLLTFDLYAYLIEHVVGIVYSGSNDSLGSNWNRWQNVGSSFD